MAYKILIVDDEPDLEHLVRQKFRHHVREGRFELRFAHNGKEALDQIEEDPNIDLVLSDINMPVMDGLTLLGRLEGVDRLLKAIIVSAYGDMQNIRTAMNRGAHDFVTKPIDFQDLEVTINKTLRTVDTLKQAQREREQLLSIQQELNVASRIQLSILPRTFPAFPNRSDFDLFAAIIPAKHVGGDFYDFFLVDEDRLGLVIGDVCGKGVPAAIFMAVSRTLLRATALQKLPAGSVLQYVNDILSAQDSNLFVTIFYAILNTRTGDLEYSCGGHNPPYLLSEGNLTSPDFNPVCAPGMIDGTHYETRHLQLKPGDTLLLYTDGVTEAADRADNFFSEDRVEAYLRSAPGLSPKELVNALVAEVQKFTGDASQSDDITVLAAQYKG
ncbi:MAG TPA: SpoIIE family protein phosphatase [Terriglobia bacterium]|nr:SpoIIE family protein phosphatase [Terriglobia bacterium]